MGEFVIKRTPTGVKFDLRAADGETIATSEVYASTRSCLRGIDSVKRNAPIASIEDQTTEELVRQKSPKFQVYEDRAGEVRFRLRAANGQIVAVSEGHQAKASCLADIDRVREDAPDAEIVRERTR